jgi:hypothetical protein
LEASVELHRNYSVFNRLHDGFIPNMNIFKNLVQLVFYRAFQNGLIPLVKQRIIEIMWMLKKKVMLFLKISFFFFVGL